VSDGFANRPRILRGAFVEFGLSVPPLVVPFQFNPVQLTRSRSVHIGAPGATVVTAAGSAGAGGTGQAFDGVRNLRQLHKDEESLSKIREQQQVEVEAETISFELRLDATDRLSVGDPVVAQFGVAPQLAALEMMLLPKNDKLLGALISEGLGSLLGKTKGFSFTRASNPPLVLFIWGRKRVLPVNITSMNITETEFDTTLNPTRAIVAVTLSVIEGKSGPFRYSRQLQEAMGALNLAGVEGISTVMIPG
jgi:hypothetical protein